MKFLHRLVDGDVVGGSLGKFLADLSFGLGRDSGVAVALLLLECGNAGGENRIIMRMTPVVGHDRRRDCSQ